MFRYLGIFLCSLALLSAEPTCSRFHYEEQTLRKMIMVEMLVDKFKADIEEIKGNMQDKLTEITTERTESKHQIEELASRITDMENNLKDLPQEKDVIQFSARGVKNKSPANTETLIFTTVMSNSGSGYNKESGGFTAPVGGLYVFNLQLCIRADKYLYFEIVANEQGVFRSLAIDDTTKWSLCQSYSISVLLNAQDMVKVQASSTNGGALWEDNIAWNTFDGFLIQRN